MNILKRRNIIQSIGLIVFCFIAAASSSSKDVASDIDWRGAGVGAAAGYNGYVIIGSASSEADAIEIARAKGYEYYIWDSVNGNVYAK